MKEVFIWHLIFAAIGFILGFLVSRNNPSLSVVNKIIADATAAGNFIGGEVKKIVKK